MKPALAGAAAIILAAFIYSLGRNVGYTESTQDREQMDEELDHLERFGAYIDTGREGLN